jgi:hypothetical protein
LLERSDPLGAAFDLDVHARGVVADQTGQTQLASQGVDERPEAHALNHTTHCEPSTLAGPALADGVSGGLRLHRR